MGNKRRRGDRASLILFVCSLAALSFTYGAFVGRYQIFPYRFLRAAKVGAIETCARLGRITGLGGSTFPDGYGPAHDPTRPPITNTPRACPGVNLITRVGRGLRVIAEVADLDGRILHSWDIDIFEMWPDPTHVPEDMVPKSRPGPQVHGAVVLEDGDIVFNFEQFGLIRVARDGAVVWRLNRQTHHSVELDSRGHLWVGGSRRRGRTDPDADPRFLDRATAWREYSVLELSQDGEVLNEWSVPELLRRNGRMGLYHLQWSREPVWDPLHMNDVVPFPDEMEEGVFSRGDVMISLRNVSTVLTFNRETGKIGHVLSGAFIHQHDPDFIDGNTYSVYDNRALHNESQSGVYSDGSAIVVVSAESDSTTVAFEGSPDRPFFSPVQGKHQWLPGGNLLITESRKGRAFEIDSSGAIVWEYVNYVDEDVVGWVSEVQRLPIAYADLFDDHN